MLLHGHSTGISCREYIRAVQHRLVEVEIFVLSLHQVASVATKAEERGRVDTHEHFKMDGRSCEQGSGGWAVVSAHDGRIP